MEGLRMGLLLSWFPDMRCSTIRKSSGYIHNNVWTITEPQSLGRPRFIPSHTVQNALCGRTACLLPKPGNKEMWKVIGLDWFLVISCSPSRHSPKSGYGNIPAICSWEQEVSILSETLGARRTLQVGEEQRTRSTPPPQLQIHPVFTMTFHVHG